MAGMMGGRLCFFWKFYDLDLAGYVLDLRFGGVGGHEIFPCTARVRYKADWQRIWIREEGMVVFSVCMKL